VWIDRGDPPAVTLERVPARDWVAENQAGFPPLEISRFFIFGSHFSGQVPPGRIGILIDAATAFGTGEHPTTRGCLAALDALARRRRRPQRLLDMGTGTGILALAAAKSWRRRIDARDSDPEAARVTIVNARRNGAARWIAVEAHGGYRDRGLKSKRPFDVVFANILARPLIEMAPDLARALAPGGVAILSGLLARQEAAVLAAHRAQGLRLLRRISIEGWNTLVVARRRRDARSG
jgi:ribosomal protein L11 methyltransferase